VTERVGEVLVRERRRVGKERFDRWGRKEKINQRGPREIKGKEERMRKEFSANIFYM
jgi:hypothetical protein